MEREKKLYRDESSEDLAALSAPLKRKRIDAEKRIPHFIVLTINKGGGERCKRFFTAWKSFRIHSSPFVRRRKVTGAVTLRVTEFWKLEESIKMEEAKCEETN